MKLYVYGNKFPYSLWNSGEVQKYAEQVTERMKKPCHFSFAVIIITALFVRGPKVQFGVFIYSFFILWWGNGILSQE